KPLEEDVLIESLIALMRELGRFPVKGDLLLKRRSDPTFPSHNTFNRLGPSKAKRAEKVLERCLELSGLEDVAALCAEIAASGDKTAFAVPAPADVNVGFVYLLKSGRYYKIRKTNAAGRRQRQLAIQLPEKATTV